MRSRWLNPLLLLFAATWLWWWLLHDPLPDGYQNEYLLIGNAFDLWQALVDHDLWHLRWYAYTGYWPFGLYVLPWPLLALFGPSRGALVAGNLVHLAVLLWAARDLGRRLDAPLAAPLALLAPGVFGTLVRYEPNLAATAWTAAGLAFVVRSPALRSRWAVVGWGSCLGIGLMMDRLTVAFFLLPAVLPAVVHGLRHDARGTAKRFGLGVLVALLWCGAYYREFFLRHVDELWSQAPVGEIDSAGQITATDGPLAALYYPLVLLDSQAGPLLGAVMILGFGAALVALVRRPRLDDPRTPLVSCVLFAGLFFTLIAKKQVFYTLPLLVPLAVLAGRRPLWAFVGLAGGLWSFLSVGVGLVPGGPWLPLRWVAPRHIVARAPTNQHWPLDAALEPLSTAVHVAVLSQDSTLFEGFLILEARQAQPGRRVRGVVLDPHGSYEQLDSIDGFLWCGPSGEAWPRADEIQAELTEDHYDLSQVPPVWDALVEAQQDFEEVGRWSVEGGDGPMDLVSFRRQ